MEEEAASGPAPSSAALVDVEGGRHLRQIGFLLLYDRFGALTELALLVCILWTQLTFLSVKL